MSTLSLVIGLKPVFREKAQAVETVDAQVRSWVKQMNALMQRHQGVGLGANMVGLLKRIVVIDLTQAGVRHQYAMINPVVTPITTERQIFEEASLSFPGIKARIERPAQIEVTYLDPSGEKQVLQADGFLATVIQHEVDYLDGRIFIDYLPKFRRANLIKKLNKKLH